MDQEQRTRWKHAGDQERTEVMRFLLDGLGLSATKAADYLCLIPKKQDEINRRVLADMSEKMGTGEMWVKPYEELAASEALPIALRRTFLVCWGEHKQDFHRISFQ